jgi:hypothetical protein
MFNLYWGKLILPLFVNHTFIRIAKNKNKSKFFKLYHSYRSLISHQTVSVSNTKQNSRTNIEIEMELIVTEVVSMVNAMHRIDIFCYQCTNSKSYSSILILQFVAFATQILKACILFQSWIVLDSYDQWKTKIKRITKIALCDR